MNGGARISSDSIRKGNLPPFYTRTIRRRAFTIIELLVVVAIIAVLAAMILPRLSQNEHGGPRVACMIRLRQVGISMLMYSSDHNIYPSALGGPPFKTWADQLASYNPLNWTNRNWHCPTYIAEGGKVIWPPPYGAVSGSYAYNVFGMTGYTNSSSTNLIEKATPSSLGLSRLKETAPENRIVAPGDMYMLGDTRPFQLQGQTGFSGPMEMHPFQLPLFSSKVTEAKPPHADGYNLLFVDGHVSLVKRRDYLFPPRSAQNWNRDNQPHSELWSPTNEWVIQN